MAMQLSILLKLHLPSISYSSSSSPSSLHTSWLSTLKQQTHHAHTQLLELLITQGWLRRGEIIAEDMLALFLAVLLLVCFSVVMGGVMLTWVRGKEEEEEEEEEAAEEEKDVLAGRVKRTSLLPSSSSSSSLALFSSRSTRITSHRPRSNSSRNNSSNSNNQLISTTTTTSTSSKKRGNTTTTAVNTIASPPGDFSSSLFLDVPFSSQWQCVVHDRRASPTLLADRDLDAVAAATAAAATTRRDRQQRIPVAKDMVARLLVDDPKLRGVVLSAKT